MPDEEERREPIDDEATYPDGTIQNECWADSRYTSKRSPDHSDEDLSVLRGD